MSQTQEKNSITFLEGTSQVDSTLLDLALDTPNEGGNINPAMLGGLPTGDFQATASTQIVNEETGSVHVDEQATEDIGMKKVPNLAQLAKSGQVLESMQTLTTFPKDWWAEGTGSVTKIMRESGNFLGHLKAHGMYDVITKPLGVLAIKSYKQSDAFSTRTAMNISVPSQRDRIHFKSELNAMPVVMSGFTLDQRTKDNALRKNFDLVNVHRDACIEKVVETLEKNCMDNSFIMGNDVQALQSIFTYSAKADVPLGTGSQWNTGTTLASTMYNDIIKLISILNEKKYYKTTQKVLILVNPKYRVLANKIVTDTSTSTFDSKLSLHNLLKSNGEDITLVFHPDVPLNKIAAVAMNKKGTALKECIVPTTIEWRDPSNPFESNVLVIGMMPVHFYTDWDLNTNIVIGTMAT